MGVVFSSVLDEGDDLSYGLGRGEEDRTCVCCGYAEDGHDCRLQTCYSSSDLLQQRTSRQQGITWLP